MRTHILVGLVALAATGLTVATLQANEGLEARQIKYPAYPPAPEFQSQAEADRKSDGCVSCHTPMDNKSMHRSSAVVLGCTDCHGGNAKAFVGEGMAMDTPEYDKIKFEAHVPAMYPEAWNGPANPERSYTILNKEAPEYVRFINPGDLRIARESCGACHGQLIGKVERSIMSTGAMFWGGAAYNNGILPYKRYIVGSAYTREGEQAQLESVIPVTDEMRRRGMVPFLAPLPSWETVPPADNFRIFERGGRLVLNTFPEIGQPNRDDEPGKPDVRQSNRGLGTGSRISVPVLNIHKTRLNDPITWFLGTGDNPGDFRSSGCTSCHVIYANDRTWYASGSYAKYGNFGQTATVDPTIKDRMEPRGVRGKEHQDGHISGAPSTHGKDGEHAEGEAKPGGNFTAKAGPVMELEHGHPIKHEFTRAIPTSQCMTCHHHQPNQFVNSFLGFTMWDYESDGELMWPKEQQYPTIGEMHASLERNPEEAVIRGKWADSDFSREVAMDVNPKAKDTQFADYHGHGWNFRAAHKRDRKGNLLDAEGNVVPDDLPPDKKWKQAVHLRDIHADYGMQCADCHFSQDAHGDGMLYGETAAAGEIQCEDCHGNADKLATLRTSGPAAPPGGTDLSLLRNMDGRLRFEWRNGKLYQRLTLPPHDELEVSQVKKTITPGESDYNSEAARAKTISSGTSMAWGEAAQGCERAHDTSKMACYTCHSSWVTSCGGCHLPIQANWKTERHHFEGGETRNFATYNPQVARDDVFQLGKHGEAKNWIIAPIRSSSALVLSSTDINRNRIYVQQPPISAGGLSSQAFAPHFPHTVRKNETKQCSDCHVSEANDNNAIMAQLLLHGTQFMNFTGFNAWVGTEKTIEAIQVTEWDEPQAVIGSHLHKLAYPDWYNLHVSRKGQLVGREVDDGQYQHASNDVNCVQLRGEYLWVAEGKWGMQAYDVANIANKGFSERFITAPFSPMGHNTRIKSKNATCVAMPTNQPLRPELNRNEKLRQVNLETELHAIYSYAAVTDAEEGLILVNVETMHNFEPRDNFFTRQLTWNPDGILDGARHAYFAGTNLYVSTPKAVVVVDLDEPLEPKVKATIPLNNPQSVMVQFRYLFAVDADGFKVVDVTLPEKPKVVAEAFVPLKEARRLFVSRTYAYVAAGSEGLAIIDVEKPEQPKLFMKYTAEGRMTEVRDVVVSSTNASLFAYVADGAQGLKVLQLTNPVTQPKFYGFSPEPKPELISWRKTRGPALSLSRPLERDRGVDETGHQMAVFGRIGSRPFNLEEQRKMYMRPDGSVWTVRDRVSPTATGADSGKCEDPSKRGTRVSSISAATSTSAK
jgi:hypothetical protein